MKIEASARLMASALTTRTIEKAIKQKFGIDTKLYKGNGYYYFSDPDDGELKISSWPETSVYVNRVNQLTLDQWLYDFENLMKQGDKNYQHHLNE